MFVYDLYLFKDIKSTIEKVKVFRVQRIIEKHLYNLHQKVKLFEILLNY